MSAASTHTAILIAVMAIGTALLRFSPFLVFKKYLPAYVVYLGKVLPPAIIGMLVVYCLRSTPILTAPHGLPELIAVSIIVLLHVWKRNSLLSILSGTITYIVLVQYVF